MSHRPRSYLFVPGDSPRKIEKAADCPADAVILDLEDSVAAARKDEALRVTRNFLAARGAGSGSRQLWVRVPAAPPEAALRQLCALPLSGLAGIVLPKLEAHWQLQRLGHWLDALEIRDGIAPGQIAILGIITETACAVVGEHATSLARGHPRLRGYTWGTEDLSAVLGRAPLPGATDAAQRLADSMQMHCLLIAAAAGADAIDGISADVHATKKLAGECERARELGYVAKLAIHPSQLDAVNNGFMPPAQTVEWARRVRAQVRSHPESASFTVDGRMVDAPHIDVAARILARAGLDQNHEPGNSN